MTETTKNNRSELFRQIFLFAFVGGMAAVVDFSVYFVLTSFFHVNYLIANTIIVSLAICWAFIGNSYFTFAEGRHDRFLQALKFLAASLLSLVLQNSLLFTFVQYGPFAKFFGTSQDIVAKALAIAIVSTSNFILNKYWVFTKKKNRIK